MELCSRRTGWYYQICPGQDIYEGLTHFQTLFASLTGKLQHTSCYQQHPPPILNTLPQKKKKERKQKASRLGIHCAICFQCDLQLAACDCTYSFVRDISKYIALVNFCRVQSYSLETLFLLPLVKGHYIKQGYSKPPFPKKLRGINETALRHF